MPVKNPSARVTAESAYESAHLVAQELTARICELLQDMPAPGDIHCPIKWGHVGDMANVNDMLSVTVKCLEGLARGQS